MDINQEIYNIEMIQKNELSYYPNKTISSETNKQVTQQKPVTNHQTRLSAILPPNTTQLTSIVPSPLATTKDQPISYAAALAPPNMSKNITNGKENSCAVIMERVQNTSLDTYIEAIWEAMNQRAITYIGQAPEDANLIIAFVKSEELVNNLIRDGIWIGRKWIQVSNLEKPAKKIVISGAMPFISDKEISDQLRPYGKMVYQEFRRIPAATRNPSHKGIYSFRREAFLILDQNKTLPERITILNNSKLYTLEISAEGPKCYKCGLRGHLSMNCSRNVYPPRPAQQSLYTLPKPSTQQLQQHNTEMINHNISNKKKALSEEEEGEWQEIHHKRKLPRTGYNNYFTHSSTQNEKKILKDKNHMNIQEQTKQDYQQKISTGTIGENNLQKSVISHNTTILQNNQYTGSNDNQAVYRSNKQSTYLTKSANLAGQAAIQDTLITFSKTKSNTEDKDKAYTMKEGQFDTQEEKKESKMVNSPKQESTQKIIPKLKNKESKLKRKVQKEMRDRHERTNFKQEVNTRKHLKTETKLNHETPSIDLGEFVILKHTASKVQENSQIQKKIEHLSGEEQKEAQILHNPKLIIKDLSLMKNTNSIILTAQEPKEDEISEKNRTGDQKSENSIEAEKAYETPLLSNLNYLESQLVGHLIRDSKNLRTNRRKELVQKYATQVPKLKDALKWIINEEHLEFCPKGSPVFRRVMTLIEDLEFNEKTIRTRGELSTKTEHVSDKNFVEPNIKMDESNIYIKFHPPEEKHHNIEQVENIQNNSNILKSNFESQQF